MSNKEVGIRLKVASTGLDQIRSLSAELRATSVDTSQLDQQAARLDATLTDLGKKQRAVESFKSLKRETDSASKALSGAAAEVERLGAKLPEAASASERLAVAERNTAQAFSAAKADLAQKTAALAKLREDYTGAARDSETYRAAEAQLSAAIKIQKQELQDKQIAQRAAAQASAEAQKNEQALTSEYNKSVESAKKLSAELGAKRSSLDESRTALKSLGVETTNLAQTERALGDALKEARTQATALVPAYQQLQQQQRDFATIGVESQAKVRAQIDEVNAAYGRLKASGQLAGAEGAKAALAVEQRIRELNKQTGDLANTFDKAKTAIAGVVAAGAGLGVVSKQAITFESAMADVRKVVEGTEEQIKGLGSELKQLSANELPLTADGLAKIAAAGGQIGIPIERIKEFTVLAAKMATAFDMSAEDAGSSVAKLANNFNLPLEAVAKLGDAINVLGNTTAAKEKDIVEVLTRVGGGARQFKLTAEQAAALAATLLSLGTSAEVTATGISAMLVKLQTAASGTTEFRDALASIGISAQKLGDDISQRPQQALVDFLGVLQKLDEQTRTDVLVKLFGLEYQDDIARLLGSLDKYRENLGKVADTTRTAGSMQKEFAERAATTANKLQLLENSLKSLAINLGDVLLPVIKPVADGLRDVTSGLANFAEANPEIAALATALASVVATVGALRLAYVGMGVVAVKVFGDVASAGKALALPMAEAAAAVGKIGAAFGALSAGVAGWELGKWARENFETVRLLGIGLAEGLTKVAEQVRFRWEQMKAAINGSGLDVVEQQHAERLNKIREIYGQIAQDSTDAAIAQKKAADDASAGAAKSGQAAKDGAAVTQAASTDAAKAVSGVAQAFVGVTAAATAAGQAGASAMTGIAGAAGAQALSYEQVVKAATSLGVKVVELSGTISAETDKSLADFGKVVDGTNLLRDRGIDTAAAVRQAIGGMFKGATTEADAQAIISRLVDMAKQGKITGADLAIGMGIGRDRLKDLRQALEDTTPGVTGLSEASRKVGVDFDLLTKGIRAGFRQDVEAADDLLIQMKANGVEAKRASPLLAEALNKQIEAAKTKEEMELLRKVIDKATSAGYLFGTGMKDVLTTVEKKALDVGSAYSKIFKDQERYNKLLKEMAGYDLGATAGLGSLGGSQAARNAGVNSTIKSDFDINQKSGTIGSVYTPPPDNTGDWEWVVTKEKPGGVWQLSAAGSARRDAARAAEQAAIRTAYDRAGLPVPGGNAGQPLLGFPLAVLEQLTMNNGQFSLRDVAAAAAPAPAPSFSAAAPAPNWEQVAPEATPSSALQPININLGGMRASVLAPSKGDAEALQSMLRQLTLDQARAA